MKIDMIAAQSPAYLGALDAWRPRAPSYRPFFPDRNDFDPDAALAGAQFGYAVLDDCAMPIVGEGGQHENDNFVEQLVMNAEAAVADLR